MKMLPIIITAFLCGFAVGLPLCLARDGEWMQAARACPLLIPAAFAWTWAQTH